MALTQIAVTIPASGVAQISTFLPNRTGGPGNLLASAPGSSFADSGTVYMQNATFQNQGSHPMYIGNSTTTNNVGGGLQLTSLGSFTATAFINYGTYISDWFCAGTPGDVLVLLFVP